MNYSIFLNCFMKSERKQSAGTQLSTVLNTLTDLFVPSSAKTPEKKTLLPNNTFMAVSWELNGFGEKGMEWA